MKIVIVGAGSVGASLTKQLVKEGHDITVVDKDESVLSKLCDKMDISGIIGTGLDIEALNKAEVGSSDLVIASTPYDDLNILCCAACKKLGTTHTIARVRNPEYKELIGLLQSDMNLSFTINPELTLAREIYRLLKYPNANKIDTFCNGKVEVAEFALDEDSALVGCSLNDLRSKYSDPFLVCAVHRGEDTIIPRGGFVLEGGDVISLTIPDYSLIKVGELMGGKRKPIRNVLIAGGNRTTYYLLDLLNQHRIKSTVVESDMKNCKKLSEDYPKTLIINDSPTNQERLLEEGLEDTDAFLALSDVDEENAITSMYAKSKNVRKIITMISSMSYVDFFRQLGLESIVSERRATENSIVRFVRGLNQSNGTNINTLYQIMGGEAEAIEFIIREDVEHITNIPLKELHVKNGALVACILRDGEIILPTGSDEILKGDSVLIVTNTGIRSIEEII